MKRAFWLVAFLWLFSPGAFAAERPEHRRLAEYYAPVIYQEAKSAVLDFVTRFDFDGDWNGANNWKNAYLHELPAYVYYAVIESSNHYFITYAFFHPRDYTAQPFEGYAPKTEHENDMEGATLTIEKDDTAFGKPILLETLAHDKFYTYANPNYRRVQSGRARLDGSIVFLKQQDAQRHREPALYIEPEGHGVKGAGPEILQPGYEFPGIVYRFAGRGAEVPESNRDPDASYDLLSIEDTLWSRRFDVGSTYCCSDPFAFPGGPTVGLGSAFNGPVGGCAAKPPWGWDQANDAIVKGDWFRDPLKAYASQLRIEDFEDYYTWNPYLDPDSRSSRNMCSESDVNKDVRGAVTSSLLGIARAITGGGLSRQQMGANARQLFLGNTVLLEWARNGDFELWSWDKALSAVPAMRKNGLVEELAVGLEEGPFAFSSPTFKAPTRYFDSVIMRYKCSIEGATAHVFWNYEDSADFAEERSAFIPICSKADWSIDQIDLTKSSAWDAAKAVARIKVEVRTADNAKVVTVDPSKPESRSAEFLLNYLVFDRAAFSDTFQR